MSRFPESYRFRHPWRPYQQRVLDAFAHHLADRHFHVAAAPGAGKTVLGLEALRRLDTPSLVLAPSLAIRDQWLLRLRECFLDSDSLPDWVSSELERPALLTVGTYQGLHAAQRRLGRPGLIAQLRDAGIGCLVLDEAHHLRQAWWQCLEGVKQGLDSPWLVALTATPPFDVPQQEWNRYIGLCGPIDAEVSAPELVRAGNLCPHQDYLYFSRPAQDEAERLQNFASEVRSLLGELVLDAELITRLAALPMVREPQLQLDALGRRSDFALALAVFLQAAAAEHARPLLHVLGLNGARLPGFERAWAELLLSGLLIGPEAALRSDDAVAQRLLRRLRAIGALELRQIDLRAPPHLMRLLESSRNKCDSISAILEFESGRDPEGLRVVVLCDRIREEDFPQLDTPEGSVVHLGVVPVFERLRRLRLPQLRLGILSGSVVVIPAQALPLLQARLGELAARLSVAPLWHATDHLRVSLPGPGPGLLLEAITALFEAGEINALIGTTALLGEGWDAPALNTLVLASAVRTAMSSNQLRGRAIRTQRGNPDKTANLWHLVCLHPDPDHPGGPELQRLSQRFRTFAGLGHGRPVIESGLDRLGLDASALAALDCAALNARMCAGAADRFGMAQGWRQVLADRSGTPPRQMQEARVSVRRLASSARFLHGLGWERLPWLRWWRALRLRRHLRLVGEALLQALSSQAQVNSTGLVVEVMVELRHVRCRLRGADVHEEALFTEALREFFDLPQNPRYLLRQRGARYVVPTRLAAQRRAAETLQSALQARLGRMQLIYTRNEDGRLALLQAREAWLAERFESSCETRMVWG